MAYSNNSWNFDFQYYTTAIKTQYATNVSFVLLQADVNDFIANTESIKDKDKDIISIQTGAIASNNVWACITYRESIPFDTNTEV
jgi:hypothetical protein